MGPRDVVFDPDTLTITYTTPTLWAVLLMGLCLFIATLALGYAYFARSVYVAAGASMVILVALATVPLYVTIQQGDAGLVAAVNEAMPGAVAYTRGEQITHQQQSYTYAHQRTPNGQQHRVVLTPEE